MKFLKKLYNLLFEKEDGEKIINMLSDNKAYQTYLKTNNSTSWLINQFKVTIESNIEEAIKHKRYSCKTKYSVNQFSKEEIRLLKEDYKNQGYKVRKGICILGTMNDRDFIVSWKHYKTL